METGGEGSDKVLAKRQKEKKAKKEKRKEKKRKGVGNEME